MPNSRFLPLLLALPACSDTYDFKPDPGFGELGVGVFLYRCPFGGDPHCANGEDTAAQFPRAFALGGRINLRYDWRDDDDEHLGDPLPQLQSAASSLLVRQGDGFTALVPGYAAVLAVTGNSQVVDLRHLHIREIDSLQIVPGDMTGSPGLSELDLAPGARPGLQAIALDSDDVLLGGVLGYTWTTADPTVVAILAGSEGGLVRLEALTPGATVLTLSQGGLSVQLPITVTEASITSTDDSGSSGATDSSTGDTGSDTEDTDTGSSSGDTSGDTSGSTGGAL